MKKLLAVLAMVLIPSLVYAGPWLTCTSVPAGSWDSIGVQMDSGAEVFVTPKTNTDGTQTLWYDLASISVGNHRVTLRGKKGVWYSATPFVFDFTRPSVPSVSGVVLSE